MADLEKDLYEPVRSFVTKRFGCFATGINVGLRHGRIDVAGLRDTGGDLSGRDELIAVEVKRGTQPFATCAGQTVGYSVFADRCFLAEYRPSKPFSSDEEAIAAHLGIGLIRIRGPRAMDVVLSAPTQTPIDRLRTGLVERLGYSRCVTCSNLFQRGDTPNDFRRVVRQERNTRKALERAVTEEKGLAYWLGESEAMSGRTTSDTTYRRRYVCPDCMAALFAHLRPDDR
jgi:hypothetical protein